MYKLSQLRGLNLYLYYFMKLTALCPFVLDQKDFLKFSYIGTFYTSFLIIIYTLMFTKALEYRNEFILYEETPLAIIINIISMTLTFLNIVSCWLIFACGRKPLRGIYKTLETIEGLARDLEVYQTKCDCKKYMENISLHFVIMNIGFVAYCSYSLSTAYLCQDMQHKTVFWFFYNLPGALIYNACLMLIEFLIIIRKHYEMVNNKVRDVLFCKRISFAEELELTSTTVTFCQKLDSIGRLHANLTDLSEVVVRFFSLPMLLLLSSNLANIIESVHAVYQCIKRLKEQGFMEACVIFGPLNKFMGHSVVAFFICSVPVWTCDQAKKTAHIINGISHECHLGKINKKAISKLMLLLLHKRLETSIFGFFQLDFNLLRNMCTTAMMYLVIMIQLDALDLERKNK